jgi:hypothetical protein
MSDYSQLLEELKLTYAYIDFLEAGGTGTPPVAPIIKDVPALTVGGTVAATGAVGSAISVTNGNWRAVPTEYHYAWKGSNNPLGTDVNTYTPVEADIGKQVTCVVSAVNAVGTTAAPPSNAVEIVPAGAQLEAAGVAEVHHPAAATHAEPRAHAAPANHSRAHR